MPRETYSYLNIDCYLFTETEKAYGIKKRPDDKDLLWIPRSLTEGCVKFAPEGSFATGPYRFCRMKVADFKVEELDL